ncbi:MAG TPA: hypothetical protein VK752_17260 [Bryobacteraceae bacterium]|jgi:hypothetical protein|nr:hypothetical protein [Bryobacteraceae bacterium]
MTGTPQFQQRLESIEVVIKQIEATADPNVRTASRELVQLVMELHGAGLERILEILRSNGETGQSLLGSMGRDETVSSLLVLYGLHPLTLEERVNQALEKVNRQIRSRSATVELLGMEEGAVRLNLQANGHGPALKEIVEDAIWQAAPDIASLVIDGAEEKQGFVPIEMLLGSTLAKAGV